MSKQTTTVPAVGGLTEKHIEKVRAAMIRAYNLGQTYWMQADSEYVSEQKKSDGTAQKFIDLNVQTCAALSEALATRAAADTVEVMDLLSRYWTHQWKDADGIKQVNFNYAQLEEVARALLSRRAAADTSGLTHEAIRAAGGIVHKDGNIFFTNLAMLNRALLAANAGGEADQQAHVMPPFAAPARQHDAAEAARNRNVVMLASRLAADHGKTLRTLFCDGAPTGRMLVDCLAGADTTPQHPAEAGDDREGWYCPHCKTGVQNEHVTFTERHDPAAGGCGYRVGDWPAPAPAPAQVNAVPEGYALVPVEPTGVMKDAGAFSALPLACAQPWVAGQVYRAMLAAAPTPPVPAPAGVSESQVRDAALEEAAKVCDAEGEKIYPDRASRASGNSEDDAAMSATIRCAAAIRALRTPSTNGEQGGA